MKFNKFIPFSFFLILLLSCAPTITSYNSLKEDEILIFGNIVFDEKIYGGNPIVRGEEIKPHGEVKICFTLTLENKDVCSIVQTKAITSHAINTNLETKPLDSIVYHFKAKPQKILLKNIIFNFGFTSYIYTSYNPFEIEIPSHNKAVYLDQLNLTLVKNRRDPRFVALVETYSKVPYLRENTYRAIKKASHIPDTVTITEVPFDLYHWKYETSIEQYRIQTYSHRMY